MSDGQPKSPTTRKAIPLKRLPRWALGLVGTVGMAAGSVAVFTRDVEAGPVAMMGIGGIFFLLGISGVLPTRLKVGDYESEWMEEVGEQLAAVTELVPTEAHEELLSVLRRLSLVLPEAATPAMAGLAYEELVSHLLELALASINEGGETFELERSVARQDSRFDAVVRNGARVAVGVEIKAYTKPLGPTMIRRLADQAATWEPQTERKRVLLVTRAPLVGAARRALSEGDGILDHVAVAGFEDLAPLIQGLRRSLTAP